MQENDVPSMRETSVQGAEMSRSSSELCLECGLCCQGIWFDYVPMSSALLSLIPQSAGVIDTNSGGRVCKLPCPFHLAGRCSVYDRRPKACVNYECKLLGKYLKGDSSLEESLRVVRKARALTDLLEQEGDSNESLRGKLRRLLNRPPHVWATEACVRNAMIALALVAMFRRHFEVPASKPAPCRCSSC